ncbi:MULTISPECIES: YraN family protein [Pseudovibrio]|uniref:YraN family protein n=1 Tax=Stappiaceae TaxID=2821832 RepID=UPI0023668A79|nr:MULTISPECIES: YraN family protein [Pseudovibrio]MDD7909582.1 YraN family protein [Pseudovibrio exalbescens]MDX5595065.1 YraN family protein [Pseudovibrio sp. SPO723]
MVHQTKMPETTAKDRRIAAERKGHRAEALARWYMRLKGYRVLEQRYKTKQGEIDLIAQRGKTIAFVEVKARRTAEAAIGAITPRAQHRIEAAARLWLSHSDIPPEMTYRFDAVLIMPRRWPQHIHNLFESRSCF